MIWVGLIVWGICAVVTAVIADSRNRNPFAWLLIGAAIGIFGLVLILALPAAKPQRQSDGLPFIGAGRKADGSMMDCPDCGHAVSVSVRSCGNCGYRLA